MRDNIRGLSLHQGFQGFNFLTIMSDKGSNLFALSPPSADLERKKLSDIFEAHKEKEKNHKYLNPP